MNVAAGRVRHHDHGRSDSVARHITEPSRIDLGSTLSENMTRNLPLVSRNPYNFILFQPNVSGRANTEFGVPRKINANGFNGRINYQTRRQQ